VTKQSSPELAEIVDLIANTPGCETALATNEPFRIEAAQAEPDDLRELRRMSGGLRLDATGTYAWTVLTAPVPAGPVLLGEQTWLQLRTEAADDLTRSCYIIAMEVPGTTTGFHIVIDLNPARSGRCYLTSWDTFGLMGEMPVVATNVKDLLRWLLGLNGSNPAERTPALGDAYDEYRCGRLKEADLNVAPLTRVF
jgi:hypothetical protein